MAAEMYAGAEWDPENPRMHIGTQRFSTSDEHLEFLARCGVTNMAINDAREITPDPSSGWTVEELVEKKEKAANTASPWKWWHCLCNISMSMAVLCPSLCAAI